MRLAHTVGALPTSWELHLKILWVIIDGSRSTTWIGRTFSRITEGDSLPGQAFWHHLITRRSCWGLCSVNSADTRDPRTQLEMSSTCLKLPSFRARPAPVWVGIWITTLKLCGPHSIRDWDGRCQLGLVLPGRRSRSLWRCVCTSGLSGPMVHEFPNLTFFLHLSGKNTLKKLFFCFQVVKQENR